MDLFPQYRLATYRNRSKALARHFLSKASVDGLSVEELLALATEEQHGRREKIILDYTSSQGDERLRAEIAQQYPGLDASHIVCFAGAQEAIFACYHALVHPEEQVAAITPLFEPLALVAQGIGAWIHFCTMDYDAETGWNLDLDKWLEQIGSETRLAAINFPHNPTGHLITANEQMGIIEKARETDTWLFSDEVFRGLEYNPQDRLTPAACLYEKAISLAVMSKAYGLAGVRLGWIATQDKPLIARLLEIKEYLSICNSASDELLAEIALKNKETLFQRNVDIIQSNIASIEEEIHTHAFEWIRPRAGCLAFPKLKDYEDAREFSHALLRAQQALVLPGECFLHGKAHIRLGLGVKNLKVTA